MATSQEQRQWKRMRFKKNKVWLALDGQQRPLLRDGKALIKYQLDQPHQYWVHPEKILPLDTTDSPDQGPKSSASVPNIDKPQKQPDCDAAVCVFTDGACSGNPGPAGIGVVLRYEGYRKEISRHIGMATNNVAELEAIRTGLLAVKNRKLPVIIFTDSRYAFGLLTQGWKAKQNQALVQEIRNLMTRFKNLRFVKIKGHTGHPDNERADHLAVAAAKASRAGL